MKQLPQQPQDPNIRTLAQEYREEFTGVTGTTVTLAQTPLRTVDDVGLECVFKNGELLTGGGTVRESFTGSTGLTLTLARRPHAGLLLLFKNGLLIDPTSGLAASSEVESRERFTGLSSTAITLAHAPTTGVELLFKNGALLDPGIDYAIAGANITLGAAAVVGDVFIARYRYIDTPAALTYAVATNVITLSAAPVSSDVFTAYYTCSGAESAGYTIQGAALTLATALVASDRVVIYYPYRN